MVRCLPLSPEHVAAPVIGEQAEEVLKQVRADLDRLKATQAMWRDYARRLEEAVKQYKTDTNKAKGGVTHLPVPGKKR